MKRFFPTFRDSLRDSVLVRFAIVMSILAMLSLASIVISTLVADDISGRASAVNVSGSLRMLSFRTLSEVQQPDKREQAFETIKQFEKRLLGLDRFVTSKSPKGSNSTHAVHAVLQRWTTQIRPLELEAASGNPSALAQAAVDIPDFVDQIDQVVRLIEEELESKAGLLRVIQLGLLAGIAVISVFTILMLRAQLVMPLAHLLEAAKNVTQGSFKTRVKHDSADEMGQLGRAFNTMVEEIATMYAHLEDKVEEKTRELTRTNESLELLYRISQQLSASDLTLDKLQEILKEVEDSLHLGHSMICIRDNGLLPAHRVVGDMTQDEMQKLCSKQDCHNCLANSHAPLPVQASGPSAMVAIPIGGAEGLQGAMHTMLPRDEKLPLEKARIIETVGHHVSNALLNMRRVEEKHRLAVLEERSVIARELHDSIAQSLSYLKIQVARLEKCIDQGCDTRPIALELKDGLSSAYRELRELITTFRLRIDERGFAVALQETVAEFSEKMGYAVQLRSELSDIVFSGNEEMHVIRIIREALSNTERHAQSSAALVHITIDQNHWVTVTMQDNGKGFDPNNVPANHFGTSIMADRAHILDGTIVVKSAPGEGTTITLSFLPQKYRQNEATAP